MTFFFIKPGTICGSRVDIYMEGDSKVIITVGGKPGGFDLLKIFYHTGGVVNWFKN